jgi:hypothetical protein
MRPIGLRTRRSAVLLTALVALAAVAAPVAHAGKPARTVLGPLAPYVVPAGEGCAFDIHTSPQADIRRTITEFDDGRVVTTVRGTAILTNMDTDATFVHRVRFHNTDTYDAGTNEIVSVVEGQVNIYLWPGDLGPYGEVGASGAIFRHTGRVVLRLDADTFVVTYYRSTGKIEDVCAALS